MDNLLSEKEIINFWEENNLFKKSLEMTQNCPKFKFYDGPPFATGLPHYGHIVASTIKDIIPRYKTQNGFYVERRFGWDTHGLPIEFEIDKALDIKTPQQVKEYGIDNYNNECRKIVLKYREEWRKTITRLGRWVDFDNDYKTMDKSFMESVWWVFSELYKKGLVYKGVKVMPYSTGCTTPLSNFEATSNYKNVSDPSLTIKFKVKNSLYPNTYILVWTTTPWTLVSNLAICVNPDLEYCFLHYKIDNTNYIIASECLETYFKTKTDFTITKMVKGSDIINMEYEPLFQYFYNDFKDTAFKIISDPYVESSSGTGLVHNAPAFGKDDYRVCSETGIITKDKLPPCPLDEMGNFTENISDYKNIYIKDADKLIIKDLKEKNLVFRNKQEMHEYPFCWRSNTPLINKTVSCWFIRVEEFKDKIIENNLKTEWVPNHIRDNKFGKWLENSIDWCVSRNRYWGTPLPIWASSDFEEIVCISSADELEKLADLPEGSITDIHKHNIDHITIPSKQGKGLLRRIPEVFDCWFESGSMPYAQHGYPNTDKILDDIFPADFIAEGTDQTRGWFYTLMVISTALFNKPAFKNVIVNGLVLASDGHKMSKSKKNYPPVNDIFDKYGADAVRLYLISGPVVRAGDLKFKENDVRNIVKNVNILMFNMVKYLLQMIDLYKNNNCDFVLIDVLENPEIVTNPIDCWILQYTNKFIEDIHKDMDKYELYHMVDRIISLIDKLSRWYLKLNKNRFNDGDQTALSVFFYCMYHIIVTMAPFTPFLSEIIYQKLLPFLEGEKSVHLIQMKKSIWTGIGTGTELGIGIGTELGIGNTDLLKSMDYLYDVIEISRIIRTKKLKRELKMPVNKLIIVNKDTQILNCLKKLEDYLYNEINVMTVEYSTNIDKYVKYKLKVNPKLGKIYKEKIRFFNKFLENLPENRINTIVKNKEDILASLTVIRYKNLIITKEINNTNSNYYDHLEGDFLLLMDKDFTIKMENKYYSKLIIRFLQDFRKECDLIPSDKITIYYTILENNNNELDCLYNRLLKDVEIYMKNDLNKYTGVDNLNIIRSKDYDLWNSKIRFYFNSNKFI